MQWQQDVKFPGYLFTFFIFFGNVQADWSGEVYAGAYVELFSLPSSALFLWSEVTELDGDALFTIELSLIFGPGARTPYLTAFGSSLTD